MTRFVPVAVLAVLAASRVASAQGTIGNSAATITFDHLGVTRNGMTFFEPEATQRPLYFNLAHCTCSKAGKDAFRYTVHETAQSNVHTAVEFWVGSSCADDAVRNQMCKQVSTIQDVDHLLAMPEIHDFSLFDVINGKLAENLDCLTSVEGSATIWAFVSLNGNEVKDYKTTLTVGTNAGETSTRTSSVDTKAPPLPTGMVARGSESAIALTWKPPTANGTDVAYYQALCAKTDGTPALPTGGTARYVTTGSICPGVTPPMSEQLTKQALDNGEAAVPVPSGAFGNLDARYICGEAPGTADGMTITGLENGAAYDVIVLSVDLHGNFTGVYFSNTVTPHPVVDFWEDLQQHGSNAEGGLCLLAQTYGDHSALTSTLRAFRDDTLGSSRAGRWLGEAYYATLGRMGALVHGSLALRLAAGVLMSPLVALALLWHWLTLPGAIGLLAAAWWWRRRACRPPARARGLRATAAVGALTLGTTHAYAGGGGYQPYWEDTDPSNNHEATLADKPDLIKWHAGIRIGPYVPNIDRQLHLSPGPYEQMFGGYRMLPMLDVDRIVWTGFGQVGIGGSIGYFRKTAHAFLTRFDPGMPDATRAKDPAATNSFWLIPLELTAGYRFTWLDDEHGIPIVPYLRGGLAYYLWWVDAPDGSIARACRTPADACAPDTKALGASLGLRGAVGVAVRAERIDASTAMSMQQSGILHAGLYAELSIAKVDGFGSERRLSVGDRTWFAGVEFEF